MNLWAITIVVAIVAVLVSRGSFFSLAKIRLRGLWLLGAAFVLQVAISLIDFPTSMMDTVGFGMLMASYAALIGFCFLNLGLRGMGVVTVGVLMNTLVIGLNQGMPVTDKLWRDGEIVEEPIERTVKHRPESDTDRMAFLSDVILLPERFNESVSFGDLVLAVGLIDVAFWGSRRRQREGELVVVSGRAERRAHRRREQRRRRLGFESEPEPIFIDLTEPEPVEIDLREPVEVEAIPVDVPDGESLRRERVGATANGVGSSPFEALSPESLDREWDEIDDTGELMVIPAETAEAAAPEPIEWKPPTATIDLSAYENIQPRPRTRLLQLPPTGTNGDGGNDNGTSDSGDGDSAAV